ncbi:MAG TPA: tetratricopeptide repeat protein [Oligoflexia bacterium]|nr:tetratricopeptide repeat protein [Oligoflexia bacterium]HMR23873.1 tetratricopeptide repeat protein [Oligoflexia bacterium]
MNKIRIIVISGLLLFIGCRPAKQAYQAQEQVVLEQMYHNESEAKAKIAVKYLIEAEKSLKVDQYKKAELVLLKALETQEYRDLVNYYLAQTFYYMKRYDEAFSTVDNIDTEFNHYPRYRYLLQRLKADIHLAMGKNEDALNAYKKCLNMHSDDVYVKEKIKLLSVSNNN